MPVNVAQMRAPIFVNAADYGAQPDNGTGIDSTTAIRAAQAAANANGGGVVFLGPGTFIHSGLPVYNKVHILGSGYSATILQLKNGANQDCFYGTVNGYTGQMVNIAAAYGTGLVGGNYNWSISNLSIDGNKANQTAASYGIRVYGYGYLLQNLRIYNCYSDGIYSDWNGGSNSPGQDSMEAVWSDIKVHGCGGAGIRMAGPHDSQWDAIISYQNTSHSFHVGPNATGLQGATTHGWGPQGSTALAWLIEASLCQFVNFEGEGSLVCQVVMLAGQNVIKSGDIYAAGTLTASGLKLGQQAADATFEGQVLTGAQYSGGNNISVLFSQCQGANGTVWFAADGGNNIIISPTYQTAGKVYTGNPQTYNSVYIIPQNGLASDYTPQTQGLFCIGGPLLQLFGAQTVGMSNVATLATGGTIYTNGVRVARVTAAANVTGILLQAPSFVPGNTTYQVTVINESAFTVTFAATGSNVADGASDVIPATAARDFVWDSATNLWYPCR